MLSNVTVFDFETTGLSPQRDQVIEMAAIRCIDGEVVSEFRTMIQYNGKLTAKITEITGITDSMLVGGMDEETAFRVLNRMIGDSLLVAHMQPLIYRSFISLFRDWLAGPLAILSLIPLQSAGIATSILISSRTCAIDMELN